MNSPRSGTAPIRSNPAPRAGDAQNPARANKRALGAAIWLAAMAMAAIGFGVQYGIGIAAHPDAGAPLYSSFNALHLQADYCEQGFIKRGLAGSVLAVLGGAHALAAQLAFGAGVIALLAGVVARVLVRLRGFLSRGQFCLLALLWIASPLTFLNFGYDFGRLDQINLVLLALSLWLAHRRSWLALAVPTLLAMLIHEAYAFYGVPIVLAQVAYKPGGAVRGAGDARWRTARALAPMLAALAGALVALVVWGRFEGGRARLVGSFGAALQNPHHNALNVWLRRAGDNLTYVGQRWSHGLYDRLDLALYAAIAVAIGAGVIGVWRCNGRRPDWLAATPLAVLPLFAVGVDYARWLSLAGIVALIAITHGVATARLARLANPAAVPWLAATAGAAALLGPIGTVHCFVALRFLVAGG